MLSRGRAISALLFLLAGALGAISATQNWLVVTLVDGGDAVEATGASALSILTPLSLTILALGAVVALAGRVLRYVLAVISAAAAVVLLLGILPILAETPWSAAAPALTEATGIAGDAALSALVRTTTPTAWPSVALVGCVLALLGTVVVLASAHAWRRGGRRFESNAAHADEQAGDAPVDAIDSWDELSRGTDPTQ